MEEESKHTVLETDQVVHGTDKSGNRTVNSYSIIRKLGEGSFGKVKLCQSGDDTYAVKIFNKGMLKRRREFVRNSETGKMSFKTAMQDVLREIAVMKKLAHQNIVQLHEVIDDDENDKLFMMIEFAGNGQVLEWESEELKFYCPADPQKVYSEEEIRRFLRESLAGLDYLHSRGVIHMDIKPQNILLDSDGSVKIADFGQALMFEKDDTINQSVGTYHFFPPECCVTDSASGGFSGKASDLWALGVTLYAMVYYRLPFYHDTIAGIMDAIENNPVVFHEDRDVSPGLQDILTKLLDKSPETRATMEQLCEHPWINEGYSTPLQPMSAVEVHVTEEDVANACLPIHRVVFIKSIIKHWKGKVAKSKEVSYFNVHQLQHPTFLVFFLASISNFCISVLLVPASASLKSCRRQLGRFIKIFTTLMYPHLHATVSHDSSSLLPIVLFNFGFAWCSNKNFTTSTLACLDARYKGVWPFMFFLLINHWFLSDVTNLLGSDYSSFSISSVSDYVPETHRL